MKGNTTCEYIIPNAAEANCDDGTYLPDAPFNSALPSIEMADDSVVIRHKSWRSRKAKPSECPQFHQDLESYIGERYTWVFMRMGRNSLALMLIGKQIVFPKQSH